MKGDIKKIIDLPKTTIEILAELATDARLPVKQYMEKVLIDHAKRQKLKES